MCLTSNLPFRTLKAAQLELHNMASNFSSIQLCEYCIILHNMNFSIQLSLITKDSASSCLKRITVLSSLVEKVSTRSSACFVMLFGYVEIPE